MDTVTLKACGCPDSVVNHPNCAAIPPGLWSLLAEIAQTVGPVLWAKVEAWLNSRNPPAPTPAP